ncbi:MAG: hypothetical protein WC595_05150 [Candidatus Nanoarchaeia archaeon]
MKFSKRNVGIFFLAIILLAFLLIWWKTRQQGWLFIFFIGICLFMHLSMMGKHKGH